MQSNSARPNLYQRGVQTLQRLLMFAARRIASLATDFRVDYTEVISIAAGWIAFIPVALYADYLATSPNMRPVEQHIGRPAYLLIFGFLAMYQMLCLILGGPPSALLETADQRRRWLILRRLGLFAGIAVWSGFAVLTTPGRWTMGTGLFGLIAFNCFAGAYQMKRHIEEERSEVNLRLVMAAAEEEAQKIAAAAPPAASVALAA